MSASCQAFYVAMRGGRSWSRQPMPTSPHSIAPGDCHSTPPPPARSCLISHINQQESHLDTVFPGKGFSSTKRRLSCYSQCACGPPPWQGHTYPLPEKMGGTYVESRLLHLSSQVWTSSRGNQIPISQAVWFNTCLSVHYVPWYIVAHRDPILP